jgi:NodT family efflux transporter outer membrane factor (OMF) lipoprotein
MTVGPDYAKPQTAVPAQWSETPEPGITSVEPEVELTRWWTVFNDPQIDSLVKRAVASSKDLQAAEARIREARALRSIAAAGAYPAVTASGAYTRSRDSGNTDSSKSGGVDNEDLFDAGFDANWEIDVFGGVRRSVEAASADVSASEEDYNNVLVTLLAEAVRNYIELRGSQLRISIARENIGSQEQTLELAQARLEAGLGSELEVAQAKAQLATTEAQIPALETSMKQSIHRLGVLLGQPPGALLDELSTSEPMPAAPPEVPVGLPSELLRRRPDIRQAERELAAQTARIGVAVADLFPRFFLTGAFGLQSANLSDFVSSGSRFWSIGPSFSWPVFSAGRIRANIRLQEIRQEQALISYEQVVLTSLEEVENALVSYGKEQAARQSLAQSVESNRRSVEISNELYAKGLVDFLNVLVSQRALYQSEDALAQSDQRVLTNLAALFKALGGGWEIGSMQDRQQSETGRRG